MYAFIIDQCILHTQKASWFQENVKIYFQKMSIVLNFKTAVNICKEKHSCLK